MGLLDAAFSHIAERDERHGGAMRIARMQTREKLLWGNRLHAAGGKQRQEEAQHRTGEARHVHGLRHVES